MTEARNRYCGSKYLHEAHTWQQIGRPTGPSYACRGKQPVRQWVLRSSERYRGRPLWFAKMTGIGPMTTAKLVEAARFASREDAALSPALRFTLTSFTPEQLR